MIKTINIKNFKSVEDLTLELGRLNIIIGANGSGKTNILEAVVMGAAASTDKLDYEFLGNRIRVTSPKFMRNAFPNTKEKEIKLKFTQVNKQLYEYNLINDKNDDRKWRNRQSNHIPYEKLSIKNKKLVYNIYKVRNTANDIEDISLFNNMSFDILPIEISEFLIYTPELSFLKKFEEQAQITPLGVKGEGLFYMLKQIINSKEKTKQITDIKENLHLLDWFDDFDIPLNLIFNERKISIKDRYINPELGYFDQRSANEGFLYLLFYLVLFTSKNTPVFFAVDNIETSFNPKLCTELIKILSNLAKKYKKQVIITTHNAAILDGLNLNDDNQRLFTAYRNKKGKTNLERIKYKSQSKMKLSELWTKGFIGGIPDNF